MSNEIVKFSNQFNNVALKKFDAVHLDVLMAIASRVREKGTATVEFSFEELRGLMRLRKNLTNRQLADKIVQTNARLLALNYMFEDSGKIIQFALFTKFVTPRSSTAGPNNTAAPESGRSAATSSADCSAFPNPQPSK